MIRMTLWKMSLAGSMMIAAILPIRAFLMNQFPKRTFLILWEITMVRLTIPFTIPFRFSIYSLILQKNPNANLQTPPVSNHLKETFFTNAVPKIVDTDITTPVSLPWMIWLVGFCLCAGYLGIAYQTLHREFQMSFPVKTP